MPGPHRSLNRRSRRAPQRRCVRLLTRRTNGGPRPRPVNHLALALQGLARAIRARRRLMRLAPHVFDRALVDRETAARAATAVREAELEQALNKIYGTAAPSPPTDAPSTDAPTSVLCPPLSPWPKSRRTQQAMLREMAAYEWWFPIGQAAFQRFQEKQPHVRLSLSTTARLLKVGSDLGRLATGLETTRPKDPFEDEGYPNFEAALKIACGGPELTGGES